MVNFISNELKSVIDLCQETLLNDELFDIFNWSFEVGD